MLHGVLLSFRAVTAISLEQRLCGARRRGATPVRPEFESTEVAPFLGAPGAREKCELGFTHRLVEVRAQAFRAGGRELLQARDRLHRELRARSCLLVTRPRRSGRLGREPFVRLVPVSELRTFEK